MTKQLSPTASSEYQIGAVCQMTGLSHHVLRVWERRHRVVVPRRQSNGRRLYSHQDVHKLTLLKTLVDQGQGISTLAKLDTTELESRLETTSKLVTHKEDDARPTIRLIREDTGSVTDYLKTGGLIDVCDWHQTLEQAISARSVRTHMAVIDWPLLFDQSAHEVRRVFRQLNCERMLLIYEYASASAITATSSDKITAVRGPLAFQALESLILSLTERRAFATHQADKLAPGRQFSDQQLTRIGHSNSEVKCECPHHLVRLIQALARFEDYSADCESLNQQDADLHRFLNQSSGRARFEMEAALNLLIEVEGLQSQLETQE